MTKVRIVISNIEERQKQVASKLPNAITENGEVVIHSLADKDFPVNEHLVWLWGLLKHERRYIKRIIQEGATINCEVMTKNRCIQVNPNSSEMLHLLGIDLIIKV